MMTTTMTLLIRLKDGIYVYSEDYVHLNKRWIFVYDRYGDRVRLHQDPKDFYKISNDIIELCDEYIVWEKDYGDPIASSLSDKAKFKEMRSVMMNAIEHGLDCWMRLGIWTESGLKYVAEMDKEGEFALL